jgi:hypothetical protein
MCPWSRFAPQKTCATVKVPLLRSRGVIPEMRTLIGNACLQQKPRNVLLIRNVSGDPINGYPLIEFGQLPRVWVATVMEGNKIEMCI